MRVFIAIELPVEIKTELATLQNELRQARADVSWTKPENFHLTLKFLGEVAEPQIADITNACGDAAASVSAFSLRLQNTGVFPNLKQPKVLWVGLTGEDNALQQLHRQVEEHLQALGFAKEARAFKPHLTLGRVKSLTNIAAATAKLLMYPLPEVSFQAHELIVMQSQLHSAGSIYTPLARCGLHE